ncbi:MAG: desulfoferrodoxin [Candidatus Cloacimonetes bacterium]|nr:desulfoferrodoxin [Candidatus Cloacimonadota bacterium]
MTSIRELYRCEICGNVVEVVHEGAPALVCCGEPMNKLDAQTKDATTEKHVPYVEETKSGILVKVGKEVDHPMLEKHYIKFIEVLTKDKVCRAELSPNQSPHAEFPVKKTDIIEVREFCNVHGLWKS